LRAALTSRNGPQVDGFKAAVAAHENVHRRIGDMHRAVDAVSAPTCLTIAHLEHNAGHNEPDNLAFMCQTRHWMFDWMFDAGLYPIEAIRLLRTHWQETKGIPSHKARMKDAGAKAAPARKLSARARRAWTTRRSTKSSPDL
jgi:hypothetical protein